MKQSKQMLFASIPLGQLASRHGLLKQGFSSHTIDNHLKSGELKRVVKGVYTRQESKLSWQVLASSLPNLMKAPVTVGGLTALELQGFAQYLSLGNKPKVHLYSSEPCPSWIKSIFMQLPETELYWHRTVRLWAAGWPEKPMVNQHMWQEDKTMPVSAPEQAILETLTLLPNEMSFEHVVQLMQGLTQLSPRKLDVLLQSCKSVKVKRLFFWLADQFEYPWCKQLNVADYDLGSGKRVIAKGGRLDKRYYITVPKALHEDGAGG
jgi:hypothetical protein